VAAREIVVVVNRNSRRTDRELGPLHDALVARGLRIMAFHVAPKSKECRAIIKRAAKAGVPEIVVGGGDGTMTHAVDVLAHRETTMGVVPFGSGNSFAQSLGIPPGDLHAAVDVIAAGHVQHIDLGVVNGTHFANFSTVGISSIISDQTPRGLKRFFGGIAYGLASVRPVLTHRAFEARITWKGGRLDVTTQDIIVASGRYYGDTPLTPGATIVDDHLRLFTTDNGSALGAIRTYLALARGVQAHLPDAHIVSAPEFTIRTRKRQPIAIDGSLLTKTPAKYRVEKGALRVFVPETGVAHG
jgi:diacylglycerol kinase (ATP)